MASLSDIENALVTLVAGPLFPNITYLPGDLQPSAAGLSVRLYPGWPTQQSLATEIAAGNAQVSVFTEQGMTRNVSRYFPYTTQASTVAPTITIAASHATITLGGTITAGNVVGVSTGSPPQAYAYIVRSADTLATVAAALAAKIPGATSSGPVLTIPDARNLTVGAMTPQTMLTITRQQEQGFRVSCWAPSPQARDALVSLIDNAVAAIKGPTGAFTRFFPVTPYESARIAYRNTFTNDMVARDTVWRRDLVYMVEYPTTLIEQDPVALFIGGTITPNNAASFHFGSRPPA